MPAELHLAENPLALHLLFQRLEGLVDIVVPNENLHASSSQIDNGAGASRPHFARDCSRIASPLAESAFRVHRSDSGSTRP